jgi:hypothetical protein
MAAFSWQFLMMPRPHPGTKENQHKRFAQHIGSPRRGVFMVNSTCQFHSVHTGFKVSFRPWPFQAQLAKHTNNNISGSLHLAQQETNNYRVISYHNSEIFSTIFPS